MGSFGAEVFVNWKGKGMHRKRSVSAGIWENEVVQALSDPAFKNWVGIWSVSDRNGIFPWRPRKWAMRFTPRNIDEAERLFQELLDGGLVEKYEVAGEWYGFVVKWAKHQDPHIYEAPVYPLPTSPNFTPCLPRQWTKRNELWKPLYGLALSAEGADCTSAATTSGSRASTSAERTAGPSSPSCPSSPSGPSREKDSCLGLGEPALAANGEPALVVLPCSGPGRKGFPVTQSILTAWGEAYPGIDPLKEAKRMRLWLESSPHKQKTPRGMGSFFSNWLANAQDRPRTGPPPPIRGKGSPRFGRADQEYLDDLNNASKEGTS